MVHQGALELVKMATDLNLTLGFVESLTGGLASAALTAVPGSSKVFLGAIVSYSNEIKASLIGVGLDDLNIYTAVSQQVAGQMAKGGFRILGVELCVSMTGYAGPDAPEGKLGLVYFGICSSKGCQVEQRQFAGTRERIREKCVNQAIVLAKDYIEKELT